ncbi:MAG: oxidoreductase, partial [Deltaproteobacteria bacterium]
FPLIDVAYRPTPCMHCDDAPCMKAAKGGAIYKREDGIVIIDPVKAKGQKDLVKACPYGAIWWNEEKNVPQKCTFCAHLLDEGWREPRCVQSCPTGALLALKVEDDEMMHIVNSEELTRLHPEYGTEPRVYYRNLYRFAQCFIGGSVAMEKDEVTDCGVGARVTLMQGSKKIQETVADTFGDFKFDGLEENSGIYILEIRCRGCEEKTIEVDLKASVNVGTIFL